MAENGYGPAAAPGHIGRIPNYGKMQPMGIAEPPACIQNAMMTKDKKPFTYTPGGLDLSQIKCPSQARRMARQRSLEEQEQGYGHQANGRSYHPQGGPAPPPPPPMQIPAPPPPPPLVISVPKGKSPNPAQMAPGERPEIVIPENPIGMLRKTNSPYHWEAEKAEMDRIGPVPKFIEKAPSPKTVQMPPTNFSQQPPQNYHLQNNSYGNQTPPSPVHKPEPQYGNQKYNTATAPSPPIRDALVRQDSQFNKSPQPYSGQSPVPNGSPFTYVNTWKQPEENRSPVQSNQQNSPQPPPQYNSNSYSPKYSQPNIQQSPPQYKSPTPNAAPTYHTLPRAATKPQETNTNFAQNNGNVLYNNINNGRPMSPHVEASNNNTAPWRTNNVSKPMAEPLPSLYHNNQPTNLQPAYVPPWKRQQDIENAQQKQATVPAAQEPKTTLTLQNNSPWISQDVNNNKVQDNTSSPWRQTQDSRAPVSPPAPPTRHHQPNQSPDQTRYQSSMTIPVTPKKKPEPELNNNIAPQKEIVYVTQEPVYYCPGSPKTIPPWVKTQKEKTKTPPPEWCQIKLEGRKSLPRDLVTPPRDSKPEPEWVKKSNEMQRGNREVMSPPRYQQPVQPTWSTIPSENRKSLPRDEPQSQNGSRVIPIHVEGSSNVRQQQPQLRVDINLGYDPAQSVPQSQYTQPTQRIMRVLSPQLVRTDDAQQTDLPMLNRNFTSNQEMSHTHTHKTRIIPIQIEGGGNDGPNKRVFYHKFTQEAPPRQSKSFKVLQVITGTEDQDPIQNIEVEHGFTDL